jgi:hypothetical protein
MLKQRDLAFLKAMSSIELSPVFIRELRRAMAVVRASCGLGWRRVV